MPLPKYFNRELSWLAYNERVLKQACQKRYPLLERIKFLAYYSSNQDEFFEIRVAGLLQEIASGRNAVDKCGYSNQALLKAIVNKNKALVNTAYKIWNGPLIKALKREKIIFKRPTELSKIEYQWLKVFFKESVQPVLTPLAIDRARPFPQLRNKGLNLLVELENKRGHTLVAILPVPQMLPRVIEIELKGPNQHFVFLSQILKLFVGNLFPGYDVTGAWEFRITRNSDLYIDEEEGENLLYKIEEELYNLRKGEAVRLEVRSSIPRRRLNELMQAVGVPDELVVKIDGPLNLMRLFSVYDRIKRDELKFPKIPENNPFQGRSLFEALNEHPILLHHPFESIKPTVDFLQQAARDPNVLAIKMTLYRTSGDSPFVQALIEASKSGKQVTAMIELKARFDEAANIAWARELEEAGVHVLYGVLGYKTHAKCCLVIRQEGKKLAKYVHLGTGNYNVNTSKAYTDLGYLSAEEELTQDVADWFNGITGYSKGKAFKQLWVAPGNLKSNIIKKIQELTEKASQGVSCKAIIKINHLLDKEVIDSLYEASNAGVKIKLWIRSICCLVPGVRGQSRNIEVKSVVDRYLEHTRFIYLKVGDQEDVYLSSADWMPRNFYKRIEVAFPIHEHTIKQRIIHEIIEAYETDNHSAEQLNGHGEYRPVKRRVRARTIRCQEKLAQTIA